jgi:hypothetical protein
MGTRLSASGLTVPGPRNSDACQTASASAAPELRPATLTVVSTTGPAGTWVHYLSPLHSCPSATQMHARPPLHPLRWNYDPPTGPATLTSVPTTGPAGTWVYSTSLLHSCPSATLIHTLPPLHPPRWNYDRPTGPAILITVSGCRQDFSIFSSFFFHFF